MTSLGPTLGFWIGGGITVLLLIAITLLVCAELNRMTGGRPDSREDTP